ncbi:MAG: hypothetical protein CXZ00_00400 [Acidobacteria bacterium]|mgnify:CR=1 FL=1|nr:MAG: hypothetical protein CXZ00_00400 [Acidobacteriota bacterium]
MSTPETEPLKRETLHGWVPTLDAEDKLREALEQAFDYRGDVTITLKNGETVVGYVFDRRPGRSLDESFIRVLQENSREKLSIRYSDIAALAFTGPDAAAGKSWEAWVKRCQQKKAAGESNICLPTD